MVVFDTNFHLKLNSSFAINASDAFHFCILMVDIFTVIYNVVQMFLHRYLETLA